MYVVNKVVSDSFSTPRTVACQAPLSMVFPRQEYWSGLPFLFPGDLPNPGIEPRSPALSGRFFTTEPPGKPPLYIFSSVQSQSCLSLCDPMNDSTPGLPVHHQLTESTQTLLHCRWCHPTISSSVIPFSSCLLFFSPSGSFKMSQLFITGGHSNGASDSASVHQMNIQGWFPLGRTGWAENGQRARERPAWMTSTFINKYMNNNFKYASIAGILKMFSCIMYSISIIV